MIVCRWYSKEYIKALCPKNTMGQGAYLFILKNVGGDIHIDPPNITFAKFKINECRGRTPGRPMNN